MAALEYAAEMEAVVLGALVRVLPGGGQQPQPAAQDVAMVGDDAEMDVCGALAAGLHGVLVRTGKYRPGDEAKVMPTAAGYLTILIQ